MTEKKPLTRNPEPGNEIPHDFVKESHGELVIFEHKDDESDRISWGIKFTVPTDDLLKRVLLENERITIPDNIETIEYLSLNPQETLPELDRLINSLRKNHYKETNLELIASPTDPYYYSYYKRNSKGHIPAEIIGQLLRQSVPTIEAVEEFNTTLSQGGKKLLIVDGHGGEAPWTIGEQYKFQTGHPNQYPGNQVPAQDIIERFNDPEEYAAICIRTCKSGDDELEVRGITIFHGLGDLSLDNHKNGKIKSVILKPE